jgi:hypothetical protein
VNHILTPVPEPMNGNHESEPLTPQRALAEIGRIEALHGALARRTTGLTWMIWGIVAPAIFMTYSFVGAAIIAFDAPVAFLYPILWIPWALLGLGTSGVLWRSVGLVIPVDRLRSLREGLLTGALIVGVIVGGMVLLFHVGFPIPENAMALLGLGAGTTVAGLLGLNSVDATGRRLWVLGGLLLVSIALGGTFLLGGDLALSRRTFSVIAPLAIGLVFFGGGLYLTSRA